MELWSVTRRRRSTPVILFYGVWARLLSDAPAIIYLVRLSPRGFLSVVERVQPRATSQGNAIKCKTVCNDPAVAVATDAETRDEEECGYTSCAQSGMPSMPRLVYGIFQ